MLGTRRKALMAAMLCLVVFGAAAGAAQASIGVVPGSFKADATREDGSPETQAGAHPYQATTSFDFEQLPSGAPDGRLRNLHLDLPSGFSGDPEAVVKCSRAAFANVTGANAIYLKPYQLCPAASQVGVAMIRSFVGFSTTEYQYPVYALEAPDGVTAEFGIPVLTVPVVIEATVDTAGDFHLVADMRRASEGIWLVGSTVTLWGVPADPSHDVDRFCGLSTGGQAWGAPPCPVDAPLKPFLTNPTKCGEPQQATLDVDSWQDPGVTARSTYTTPAITGCDKLIFKPSVKLTGVSADADAPSGVNVTLDLPQADDPQTGLAPPSLRTAKVTLPEGLTINPGSADGLEACSDAQLGLHSNAPVGCPDGAKIGTVRAETPVLTEPLTGSVYLRSQNSDDPMSGEMFRLALVLENEKRGLLVKLAGQVRANPATGRLETTFADNPQLPVSKIVLSLKSGPRAPLATPAVCGSHAALTHLESWGGQIADLSNSVDVGCSAGLGGFAPTLQAGAGDATAGAFSPFHVGIGKPDGNAPLTGLSMVLPAGLVAQLKGNLGAQVGSVKAYAGPGSNPFMLPGQVFLEGRYGDAPFSLKVVVPAKAGPFDLGEVVVRQKIYVDPITAQVTVVSDPVPTIVKGVPVRLQRLDVDVDKAGFMINPTSCAPKAITGSLSAADGQTAINVRFQVGDCASLVLKPQLGLTLSGKGQTTDGKHPAITATLSQPVGQANLKKVRVTLPLSLALDTDNANGLCEFVDGSKVTPTCPKNSVVGTATATTPILDEPLTGPVYFVKNERKDPRSGRSIKTTPKLVIPLVGQNGVKLTLTGTSDVEDDRLVTTFDNIPDAPVSSFKLNINGGKGGILVVSGDKADICKATQIAEQEVDGQNNKAADAEVAIQTPSCPTKILSKKVGKANVAIKLSGLGAGKVTVTGKGIKKTTKTITKSTVATIVARRSKGTPGKVTVSFDPAGPAKVRKISK